MDIRPLPTEEAAVRRYVEELWIPYHRDLEATVDAHALADDVDLVAEEVPFRLDRLAADSYRTWVAVDDSDTAGAADTTDSVDTADASDDIEGIDLAAGDGELVGFVTTEIEAAPSVFDAPDRLVVGDLFVREQHRGTGLARELVDRAAERAREEECAELALNVDVDNERAIAFYEKLGFETHRRRMRVAVDDV